jgi:hypothetical protein
MNELSVDHPRAVCNLDLHPADRRIECNGLAFNGRYEQEESRTGR